MKKNIWIWNHYATDMYKSCSGRHYWFAENLLKEGYEPTVFCANTYHNKAEYIDTGNKKYTTDVINNIPFVFVKTTTALGNGLDRVKNMSLFYANLFSVAKKYVKLNGKPDVIIASSVHPLTMLAGIQIAKKLSIPCICEVRDLWPLTLVEMGQIKQKDLITQALYKMEKWIYIKADRLIFTMEGGEEYIKDRGWESQVDLKKVHHINNGVNLEVFEKNSNMYKLEDDNLSEYQDFKVVYAGTIGKANMVETIIDTAQMLKNKNYMDIKFIIYGDGPKKKELEEYTLNNGINNVIFKGKVKKKYIPSILSKSNLNIFTGKNIGLYKYGISLNKMFDYFASGKPTLSNIECGYDIISKYNCGVTVKGGSAETLAEGILKFYNMQKEEYDVYCKNALQAAKNFDFKILTSRLEKVILED